MRTITYKNACRQSNSGHKGKETEYRNNILILEDKRKEKFALLQRMFNEMAAQNEPFMREVHNYGMILQEIQQFESKVNEQLAAQQRNEA